MMIAGFIVTTGVAGQLLDPFSPARLVAVSGGICAGDGADADRRLGHRGQATAVASASTAAAPIIIPRSAYRSLVRTKSRRFAIFVFVSMLAYSAQDLILEPFAGAVFGFAPGETTKLSSIQHGGR